MTESEAPIRDIRANIGTIVDRAATAGATTYITRHGKRVAAIVPLNQAGRTRETAPKDNDQLRPAPSAAGGKFESGPTNPKSAAARKELAWTRAALEALHLQLTTAITELVTASGITGRALAALSERHLGTVEELMESIDLSAPNDALYEAEQLHGALIDPDDAQCETCDSPLIHFQGHTGWQHYRHVPSDLGGHQLEITEPDHPAVVRWTPRQRPAITDGAIQAAQVPRAG